ncbi:MAG: SDR family oxidoreductase [Anaerolineae bacterium]|nr:SDR family oxidoreductase [Anaerolineae bacterium]
MPHSDKPMHSKVCIVTGAASGIGAITAHALAQRGATVVIVDRDAEKGALTANQIKEQTGDDAVEFIAADLSAQQEIRRLAEHFKNRHQRLDVLVNNAGAIFPQRRESVDGIEMTFALNYLAYFLLTNLLLDTLKASAPARIINTSSRAHARAQIHFDDLESRTDYRDIKAYEHSKLAIVLFTYELARRLEGAGVTANTLHPGIVATNFAANNSGIVGPLMRSVATNFAANKRGSGGLLTRLLNFVFLSPEQGAQTGIYLATSPEVEGVTGKYFVKCKAVPSSPASYDTVAARRLWQASEDLTNLQTG